MYDCTLDTLEHKRLVAIRIIAFANLLLRRAAVHDDSKLQEPEKSVFDIYRPKLDELELGSPAYKQALIEMGDGLQHHYEHNYHHPEHFEDGIAGMTLVDLAEMVCDWAAAAARTGASVDLDWGIKRFGLDAQTAKIIGNTVDMLGQVID
ncbi:MAG: DUF5662 family protein [Planctomycetota bacterium]